MTGWEIFIAFVMSTLLWIGIGMFGLALFMWLSR